MITVNVKLFASLRRRYEHLAVGESMPVQVAEGTSVTELTEQLDLPEVKLVFINGICKTDHNYHLKDGDELAMFPLVAGG